MNPKTLSTDPHSAVQATMQGEEPIHVSQPSDTGRAEWEAVSAWPVRLGRGVVREANFFLQVIRRDLSSTVFPGLLFSAAAWNSSKAPVTELVPTLLRSLLYFSFFVFTFCLSNQIVGVEEDRINKPDRPLARGLVSIRGAWIRWALAMVLYTFIGWKLDVLVWTLLWQAVTLIHNLAGGARNWFIKDLSMGVGVFVQLRAGWLLGAPMTEAANTWILFLAVAIFVLVPVQDLRDIDGDRLSRRKTFPMVFGVKTTRMFLAVGFTVLIGISHALLTSLMPLTPLVLACDIALGLVSLAIALRVMLLRSAQADHSTYLLFTYWFCLAMVSGVVGL
jgi:4-hydroxybenzoate polyprenyltransferase